MELPGPPWLAPHGFSPCWQWHEVGEGCRVQTLFLFSLEEGVTKETWSVLGYIAKDCPSCKKGARRRKLDSLGNTLRSEQPTMSPSWVNVVLSLRLIWGSTSVMPVYSVASNSAKPNLQQKSSLSQRFDFNPTKSSASYPKLCKKSFRGALWSEFLFPLFTSPAPLQSPLFSKGLQHKPGNLSFTQQRNLAISEAVSPCQQKHWMAIALRVNTNSRHQIKLPDLVWCSSVTSWHFWCEYRGFCRKFISCSSWRIIFTYLSIYICQQQASLKWLQWLVYRLHYLQT